MTREEAISVLGKYKHYAESIYTDGVLDGKAFDMAIEALQFADKSPRTVKLTEDIVITLDEETYEIGYTHGQMADRPKGEWILVKGSNGKDYHKCSKCFHTQEITGIKNYCAVCGAIMEK